MVTGDKKHGRRAAELRLALHQCGRRGNPLTGTPLYDESNIPAVCSVWNNALRFSAEPSSLLVTYYDENEVAIAGASLESLIFGADTVVTVEIEARWEQSGNSTYYGEASYRFPLLYDVPATVTLPVNEAKPGEVWAYTVQNLNDGQTLLLDTALHTAPPSLYLDGDRVCALLPIASDSEPGTYTLSFRAGDVTSPVGLKIGEADTDDVTLDLTAERFASLSDEALDECAAALRGIPQAEDGRVGLHTGSPFTAPVAGTPRAGFGAKLLLQSGGESRALVCEGSVYDASGADVKSCAGGTVVFSGELPVLGQVVAVDHGLGVVSYYGCLASGAKHVKGDVVSAGEIVAKGRRNAVLCRQRRRCIRLARFPAGARYPVKRSAQKHIEKSAAAESCDGSVLLYALVDNKAAADEKICGGSNARRTHGPAVPDPAAPGPLPPHMRRPAPARFLNAGCGQKFAMRNSISRVFLIARPAPS